MLKFCVIDTETTGTDPKRHGLIQLAGAILFLEDGALTEVARFDFKCRPYETDEIEPSALEANGVSMEELQARPSAKGAHAAFVELLAQHVDKYNKRDKMFFVGFSAAFDNQFVREWFVKAGDEYFGSWFWNPALDLMSVALWRLAAKRREMPNFKLATVAAWLDIEPEGKFHDASVDVDVTIRMLKEFLTKRGLAA